MDLARDDEGIWTIAASVDEQAKRPDYIDGLARYLTIFDPLFDAAQERREFEFIHSLLGMRGLQGAGWDAFETTETAIESLVQIHNGLVDGTAARHLKLWLYGHIVEASEPYELLANLLDVVQGGRFSVSRFPPAPGGRPQSPGAKIAAIEAAASEAGFPLVGQPLRERWDRNLRNAIFHADYALNGGDVNLVSQKDVRRYDDLERICARANACHDAVVLLRKLYVGSYEEPKMISAGDFSSDPDEKAMVIVRAGHGVVGLKHAHTTDELSRGAIAWRMSVALPDEMAMLDADPELALLPERAKAG